MKKLIWFLAIFMILVNMWQSPAFATEADAKNRANETAASLRREGFTIRTTYWHGTLLKNDSTYITTTLYRGSSYGLVVGGCRDAYDIDVLLYDENWNLISKDTSTDPWAVVTVTPRWTGKYYIKVRMYNSKYNGAHWSLLFAYV